MGPVAVVVRDIALEDALEMATAEDEDAIQAHPAQRSHEPFRERVRPRCPDRGADDLDASMRRMPRRSRLRISSRGPG